MPEQTCMAGCDSRREASLVIGLPPSRANPIIGSFFHGHPRIWGFRQEIRRSSLKSKEGKIGNAEDSRRVRAPMSDVRFSCQGKDDSGVAHFSYRRLTLWPCIRKFPADVGIDSSVRRSSP